MPDQFELERTKEILKEMKEINQLVNTVNAEIVA